MTIQEIVQALEVFAAPVLKPLAAKLRLVQLVLLDHRAHRAVNDDDALAQEALQMFDLFGMVLRLMQMNWRIQIKNQRISEYDDMINISRI